MPMEGHGSIQRRAAAWLPLPVTGIVALFRSRWMYAVGFNQLAPSKLQPVCLSNVQF